MVCALPESRGGDKPIVSCTTLNHVDEHLIARVRRHRLVACESCFVDVEHLIGKGCTCVVVGDGGTVSVLHHQGFYAVSIHTSPCADVAGDEWVVVLEIVERLDVSAIELRCFPSDGQLVCSCFHLHVGHAWQSLLGNGKLTFCNIVAFVAVTILTSGIILLL